MKYLFVQDRETGDWIYVGIVPFATRTEYIGRSMRSKKVRVQRSWVYPKPENISAFVKAHKIIEANNEEEAKCQILN